jgi:predicted dehydrogenase
MLGHGMEHWHPDPYFFYQPGAGPLFDMGPYYLTALIAMMGPIRRVASSARITFPERIVSSEPKQGTRIPVNTPTHIAGILDFSNGPVATMVLSFDVWGHKLPRIEIYGTEGSISVPDPNTFHGPVYLQQGRGEWQDIPVSPDYEKNLRGLGVAEMVQAMQQDRQHRANGELAYHVLDTMQSLLESSEAGKFIELSSTCKQPAPLGTELSAWKSNQR